MLSLSAILQLYLDNQTLILWKESLDRYSKLICETPSLGDRCLKTWCDYQVLKQRQNRYL